ncbi:MAG: hypothetical protein HOK21_05225 [Rhodospirillaceae bacterium]|jgi:hypothetical protein|nr:hypothetical protein [Rhodospirillaceae bacterium]MBT4044094.1 hypothetical protein [Rhodospirillaceae bacterium]MBT4688901.1 hypothetical protein [Rhodospirillaceae bacterium]MBT5083245.1 hypothetical protein [Rhodospirillaceae bacterium]MBT5523466.1 hypothetical protein [Rhodospirillaceae bacterium]
MRIGIDFDNTIAGYDALFAALAEERGLFQNARHSAPHGVLLGAPVGKKDLRDALRQRPEGELTWRRLQAEAYGGRMSDAELLDGVDRFVKACRQAGISLSIVSHKTQHANFASDGTDLRKAAIRWMEEHGFFDPAGLKFRPDDVFFADTRAAKVAKISDLNCNWFIDDLEEVFAEPGFPASARAVLYDPHGDVEAGSSGATDFLRCRHWDEIGGHVFGSHH